MKRRSRTTPAAGTPQTAGTAAPCAAGDPLPLDAVTLAQDLREELADLETLTAAIAVAATRNLCARLQALGDRLRNDANGAAGGPASAAAPGDAPPAAEVASILDALERLRLRPERGRWKDLRRIARFVARAERRLDATRAGRDAPSGDREAAKESDG